MNHSQTHETSAGFSLLEFALVVTIVAAVVYAIVPRIGDGLRFAHESVVRQTTVAFRDSLSLVAAKRFVLTSGAAASHATNVLDLANTGNGKLDLNRAGFPIGTDWAMDSKRALQATDCLALWYGLLGGFPPSAALAGDSDFRVLTRFDARYGLGCEFRYRRGGDMSIGYFPDTGQLTSDDRF